jgi:hypothetical protein
VDREGCRIVHHRNHFVNLPVFSSVGLSLPVIITTTNQSFISFHGRNTKGHYWYNYLYSAVCLNTLAKQADGMKKMTSSSIEYPPGPHSILPNKLLREFIRNPIKTLMDIAYTYGSF